MNQNNSTIDRQLLDMRTALNASRLFAPPAMERLREFSYSQETLSELLRVWSRWFHLGLERRASTEAPMDVQKIFRTHVSEEQGHRELLGDTLEPRVERVHYLETDSIGAWFCHAMANPEALTTCVLSHILLEQAADTFVAAISRVDLMYAPLSNYVRAHADDAEHVALGVDALRYLHPGGELDSASLRFCEDATHMLHRLFTVFATAVMEPRRHGASA